MSKRDKVQIVIDILKLVQSYKNRRNKLNLSNLMCRTNMSYQMGEEYLGNLIDAGHIVEIKSDGQRIYEITEKGEAHLKALQEAYKVLEELL